MSTDAAVADTGDLELELGYAGFREDHGHVTIVAPQIVANLGVARDVEVVGEFNLANDVTRQTEQDLTRFENSALSVKWVAQDGLLQDDGPRPSIALELSLLLPTLRGESSPGAELVGIVSGRALGWTYHLNAGGTVNPQGSEPGGLWGIIVEHDLVGALRAVAEVNGESVRNSPADNSALVGAIWSAHAPAPLRDLSFDVGVRHGLSSGSDQWGGTAGFTFTFPCWSSADEEDAP